MIAAIVPAAGASSRMGRPKLSLPVGGRPVIERVVAALQAGGADPVVVVTGPHDPSLALIARTAGAEVCELAAATPDMRTTVEHGLRWVEERFHPRPADAWLLAPGDFPLLDESAVQQICESYDGRGEPSILIPTFAGRRGHPALIAWRHVAGIRALPASVGIDTFLRANSGAIREISVNHGGAVIDMDTPQDYESLWNPHRI